MALSSDQLEEFRQRIDEMQDDELVELLALRQGEYRPELLQLAREAINRRGLEELDAEEYIRHVPAAGLGAARGEASKPRRPWLAFLVGVFFPGLGHLYAGDPLRAAIAAGFVFVVIIPAMFLVRVLLSWSAAAVIAGLVASLVL